MNDIVNWSLPLGRWFGISVRVHLALLLFSIAELVRVYTQVPGLVGVALLLQGLLFVSILLHEFGHCFAARQVDGDADEILMWPLGGLASCQVPQLPWAQGVTAAGGPAVNVLLCMGCLGGLTAYGLVPPLNPLWNPYLPELHSWFAAGTVQQPGMVPTFLARLFYVNWILLLFNMVLIGFPMDGGRLLQAILWPRWGYHASMKAAIYGGYVCTVVLAGVALVFFKSLQENALLLVGLALFIYLNCKQQHLALEMGGLHEDSLFGYDFSQGYTSLERSAPAAPPRRQSFWKRWLEQRAAAKREREAQQDREDQLRLDELLAKIAERGTDSLTGEEQRFLTRVSAKYRNKSKQ